MEQTDNNPFFSEEDIKVILRKLKETPSKINRNLLLDYIKATAPTNVYRLHKETGFAYTSLKSIIREFEFVGLIYSLVKINENNQAFKQYYFKEEKKEINQPTEEPEKFCTNCGHSINLHRMFKKDKPSACFFETSNGVDCKCSKFQEEEQEND